MLKLRLLNDFFIHIQYLTMQTNNNNIIPELEKEEISIQIEPKNNIQTNTIDEDYILITIGFYISFMTCFLVFTVVTYCIFQNNKSKSPKYKRMRSNLKALMTIQLILTVISIAFCLIAILIMYAGSK